MAVWFAPTAREAMVTHCRTVYPQEGCGILLGEKVGGAWFVARSVPVPNTHPERQRDRFQIDPRDFLRVEREAAQDRLSVIGFFHSHPDVPPYPSPTDAAFAWVNYLTVIVAVYNGRQVRVRSHLFEGEGKGFTELPTFVLLQPPLSGILTELPQDSAVLDLTGEVEPFVTLAVRSALKNRAAGSTMAVRFDCEAALHTLPRFLTADGHTLCALGWDETGAWQLWLKVKK
ncbi:CysO-cysteine peptidase [bacterium HR17]|jgi:proteasome lid subunit RPN8/RPN11/TusA-related sulfurtransferase|uniref:CysO-cysteine peptidase n=1 Tax=Candidatus Fervidibacter japonicus TaxID=2035412 RepID=A0A2H5XBZ6_9BACT|nr:CysO-cysteine peptidase [bacterium HR17]